MRTALRRIIPIVTGIAIFVGLPLLGWGILDWREFYGSPARAAFSIVAVVLSAAVAIVLPNSGRSHGSGNARVQRQHIALIAIQILSVAIVAVPPFCDRRNILLLPGNEVLRWFGVLAFTIGFVIMNWAAFSLGRQFSIEVTTQENHVMIVLLWRIADEEKFMEKQFQGAWRSYVRRTKKLIPFYY